MLITLTSIRGLSDCLGSNQRHGQSRLQFVEQDKQFIELPDLGHPPEKLRNGSEG